MEMCIDDDKFYRKVSRYFRGKFTAFSGGNLSLFAEIFFGVKYVPGRRVSILQTQTHQASKVKRFMFNRL